MIQVACECLRPKSLPESAIDTKVQCPVCHQTRHIVCAEALPEGAGDCDFDAALTVTAGPTYVGERFLLGGVADIQIGKTSDRQIVLSGTQVSRAHCKLVRVDFGPSRWKIDDNNSTNGVWVNDQRVTERELVAGDRIRIGDFHFAYAVAQPPPAGQPATPGRAATADAQARGQEGPFCPSCRQLLPRNSRICVDCGINIVSGRPLLTSHAADENILVATAGNWIRWISWIVWITPMPIPLRSEAYGSRKPFAIWTIAAATVLASITFLIAQWTGDSNSLQRPGSSFMLWSPWASTDAGDIDPDAIHRLAQEMTSQERDVLRAKFDPNGQLSDDQLEQRFIAELLNARQGEFHWYQLITHAFLHDTSSIVNFALHLGGNLLFLLVFGTRVNALIGDLATAIAYPILAVCSAMAQLLAMGSHAHGPLIGASGAIMGLAGMYLILFPAHRVYCAMWISLTLGLLSGFRRFFRCKIFVLRGFWVLLIYFGYDLLMNLLAASFHWGAGGVAHWAHVGGFVTGMIFGLAVLLSRRFNTNGADLLSVALGKRAWPLIGKPSQWLAQPA